LDLSYFVPVDPDVALSGQVSEAVFDGHFAGMDWTENCLIFIESTLIFNSAHKMIISSTLITKTLQTSSLEPTIATLDISALSKSQIHINQGTIHSLVNFIRPESTIQVTPLVNIDDKQT
jgi:hypothetical protein